MSKITTYVLPSGTVVDLSVVKTLNVEQFTNFLESVDSEAQIKRLLVVEKADEFFTSTNMFSLIEANDKNYRMIAEHCGVVLTDPEVITIRRAKTLRAEITAKLTPPVPEYPFEVTPDGWSVATHLLIRGNLVSRAAGPSGGYRIGLKSLQRLWLTFAPGWTSDVTVKSHYIQIHGGERLVQQKFDRLGIGCQFIYRFELEQLALHQGWDFPEVKAK